MRTLAPETRAFWVVAFILASFLGPARRVEADWTATGSLSVGRGAHTSTLFVDGRVLIAMIFEFRWSDFTVQVQGNSRTTSGEQVLIEKWFGQNGNYHAYSLS